METIKIGRLTPENFSYCPLHMTFVEHLAVDENAITVFGLQFHIQISCKPTQIIRYISRDQFDLNEIISYM